MHELVKYFNDLTPERSEKLYRKANDLTTLYQIDHFNDIPYHIYESVKKFKEIALVKSKKHIGFYEGYGFRAYWWEKGILNQRFFKVLPRGHEG